MKNNPANVVKDTMWHFLIDGTQRGNAKALKEAVYDLIGMTTQKNAGQRKAKKRYRLGQLGYDCDDNSYRSCSTCSVGRTERRSSGKTKP